MVKNGKWKIETQSDKFEITELLAYCSGTCLTQFFFILVSQYYRKKENGGREGLKAEGWWSGRFYSHINYKPYTNMITPHKKMQFIKVCKQKI